MPNSTGNTAYTVDTTGASYAWVLYVDDVLHNDLITGGLNTSEITWTAPGSFTEINIGVTVTSADNCSCENDPPIGGVIVRNGGAYVSVPTFSEWGMIILSLLMAAAAVLFLMRRRGITV